MNTLFSVFSGGNFLDKFPLDTKVLDIGKRDIVLGPCWLKENGFVMDPLDRCLRNVDKGLGLPCSVRWIPSVFLLYLDEELLQDGKILLIIDASERYSHYSQAFSTGQADRLLEHKVWDHEISLQDPNAKIPTGAIYKTVWEEEEALQTYLKKELPTDKVRYSRSATGAPILFVRKKDRSLRLCVAY